MEKNDFQSLRFRKLRLSKQNTSLNLGISKPVDWKHEVGRVYVL